MGKVLVFLMVVALPAAAQENAPTGPVEEVFKNIENPWLTAGVLEFPFYWFYLGGPSIKGQAYLPNFLPRAGLRIGHRNLGAQVTLSLPVLSGSEQRRRGNSSQSGISLNSYWRQNAYDVYYQRFRGFYVSDPFIELKPRKPAHYPQLPDTRVINFGFNWYYVFQPKSYSLKAAFGQKEFQLKSGGSWIFNPFYNHLEMFLGDKFIPGSEASSVTGLPNLASGRFDTLGGAFGYGYTYVRDRFYATGQFCLGPGVQYQRIFRSDGDDTQVWSFASKLNLNASMGWNYNSRVAGVKVLVDSLWTEVVDTPLASSAITLQLFYGLRF